MKKKILVFCLFLIIIFLGFMYLWDQKLKTEHVRNVEITSVNVVKADLDLYYVVHNKYPQQITDVKEVVEEVRKGYYKQSQDSISRLKDFSYEIRGDDQAYKISYTNIDGKRVAEEVNYQADFHK